MKKWFSIFLSFVMAFGNFLFGSAQASSISVSMQCSPQKKQFSVGESLSFSLTGSGTIVYALMAVDPDSKQSFYEGNSVNVLLSKPGTWAFIGYGANGTDSSAAGFERCKTATYTVLVEGESSHEHQWTKQYYESEHPHNLVLVCECGEEHIAYGFTTSLFADCCQCVGHDWEYIITQGKRYCNRCNASEAINENALFEWNEYIKLLESDKNRAELYKKITGYDSVQSITWRVIANQATELLVNKGFVAFVNTTETISSPTESTGHFVERIGTNQYNEQQKQLWIEIIIDMLGDGVQDSTKLAEIFAIADSVDDINTELQKLQNIAKNAYNNKKLQKKCEDVKQALLNNKDAYLVKKGMIEIDTEEALLKREEKLIEESSDRVSAIIALCAGVLSAIETGGEMHKLYESYENMAKEYQYNYYVLNQIIHYAEAMNDINLEEAAKEVLNKMTDEYIAYAGNLLDKLLEFVNEEAEIIYAEFRNGLQTTLSGIGDWLIDKGIDKLCKTNPVFGAFSALRYGATGIRLLTNYDEIYQSAETLMALSTMSAQMNLYDAAKNGEDITYIYLLWAKLQIKGCNQAHDFLSRYTSAHFTVNAKLSSIGLDENKRTNVYNWLNKDIQLYEDFYSSLLK